MHRTPPVIAFFLLAATLRAQAVIESIVAKVDDTVILYSEILQEGALLNLENGAPIQTPLSPDLKTKILDSLVVRAMLLDEARERALPVDDKKVAEMIATYEKLQYFPDLLKRFELTPAEFRTVVKRRLATRAALDDHLSRVFPAGRAAPTEEQKRAATDKWVETLRKKHRIVYFTIPR